MGRKERLGQGGLAVAQIVVGKPKAAQFRFEVEAFCNAAVEEFGLLVYFKGHATMALLAWAHTLSGSAIETG